MKKYLSLLLVLVLIVSALPVASIAESVNAPTDEELAAFANNKILTGSNAYSKDETKTTVEADSFVNVDYQGLLDGVAFSGGTAKKI